MKKFLSIENVRSSEEHNIFENDNFTFKKTFK